MQSGPSTNANRLISSFNLPLIVFVVAVVVYAIFIGIGLLSGHLDPLHCDLLLAVPCLVPAIWYLVGFLRVEGGDFGLVLSSLGWFLAALLFFWRHLATGAALARGLRPDQAGNSPAMWIFALLSVASLLSGAFLSGRYWMAKNAV